MNKKNPKRIAALACVVILVALYLMTLIFAIADFPGWQRMFGGCLVGTIALPILLWVYIWLYGKIKDRHTIASFDIGGSEHMDEKTRKELKTKNEVSQKK